MRKNILYLGMATGLAILFLYGGCKKDNGFYGYKNTLHDFSGNTYDFLKSQEGVYDSFLLVIDRLKLTDSLKNGNYTVFAPTNASFQQAVEDLNNLRKIQGRGLLYLSTVAADQLDSLLCRYIIRGIVPSDSMKQQDGINLAAIRYGYTMHGKYNRTAAEGHVEGGPGIIEYSDTKGSIYFRQWSVSHTVAVDIKTTNGLVNVLDRDHEFGFDEFIGRLGPTFSSPYLADPFMIPGTIAFEQYDKGGEGVAYHDDNPLQNNGGKFRPDEGVDIENASNGDKGYDVGWTVADEWMKYTVNIMDTGLYKVIIRAAGGNNGALHFELDDIKITDLIKTHGTGGYQDYDNYETTTLMSLPKGKHILKVYYDFANFNLRFVKFLPVGRPFPVPGVIPAEEFDPGGEGVAYHDADGGNNGGQYRTGEAVDITQNGNGTIVGGYEVGWTTGGEWLNYTIDVKEKGTYELAVSIGSPNDPNGGNRFHIEIDGADVTGPMNCPNTGGYSNWTDVKKSVFLEKGIHVMKFYLETGGYDFRSFTFKAIN